MGKHMNIVVCVKQVPDTTEVRIDPDTNTLIREGVSSILNPYDQFAVEEGIRIKKKLGEGRITALSMGPPQARTALMKCLALGADEAVLLSDRAFAGADTWATAFTLTNAIDRIGDFDIVLCGQQAIDGDTAQVGPELAQGLGIPQVTYVEEITNIQGKRLELRKQTEEGYQFIEVDAPVLLSLMPSTSFEPGIPPMSGIMKAKRKPFEIWDAEMLGDDPSKYGLDGSFTQVVRTYAPPKRGECKILEGEHSEAVSQLIPALVREGIIKEG